MTTIGDELSGKGISWAWYAGGWDDAVADRADKNFQFHHQPFAYFRKYTKDTPGRLEHLKDAKDFIWALMEGEKHVPAVVFYKPSGELNEHPGYANVLEGDAHLGRVLHMIEQSPIWSKSIVIVTFDENGGYWDHVPPPTIDPWVPRRARADGDHLALRQEGLYRPQNLRYDRDLEAYRDTLRARVSRRPRLEVQGPDQRLRLRRPSARAGLQTLD
jgi:phospholipase C